MRDLIEEPFDSGIRGQVGDMMCEIEDSEQLAAGFAEGKGTASRLTAFGVGDVIGDVAELNDKPTDYKLGYMLGVYVDKSQGGDL